MTGPRGGQKGSTPAGPTGARGPSPQLPWMQSGAGSSAGGAWRACGEPWALARAARVCSRSRHIGQLQRWCPGPPIRQVQRCGSTGACTASTRGAPESDTTISVAATLAATAVRERVSIRAEGRGFDGGVQPAVGYLPSRIAGTATGC